MTAPELGGLVDVFDWRKALVRADNGLGKNAVHVGLLLAGHMNRQGGGAFPNQETLAAEGRVSRSTVYEGLKELREKGWLEVRVQRHRKDSRRRKNHYITAMPKDVLAAIRGEVGASNDEWEAINDERSVRDTDANCLPHGHSSRATQAVGSQEEATKKIPPNPQRGNTSGRTNRRRRKQASELLAPLEQERFDEWWAAWPNKVAKSAAIKAWSDIERQGLTGAMTVAAGHYQTSLAAYEQRTGEAWPMLYPATFLNGRWYDWQDGPVELRKPGENVAPRPSPVDRRQRLFDQMRHGTDRQAIDVTEAARGELGGAA